jgi:hypothetical protein
VFIATACRLVLVFVFMNLCNGFFSLQIVGVNVLFLLVVVAVLLYFVQ